MIQDVTLHPESRSEMKYFAITLTFFFFFKDGMTEEEKKAVYEMCTKSIFKKEHFYLVANAQRQTFFPTSP